jgi:integrase
MKFVDPIREKWKIEEIKNNLEESWNYRDLLLFVAGINFALRIQDLLQLKIGDLYQDGVLKDFFDMTEKKTKKKNRIFITENVRKVLKLYISKYPFIAINTESYVFFSQKNGKKPLGRRQALNIVHSATHAVWLQGNFGTHTFRKTWGYQARKNDVPLEIIQHKLNHASLRVTERYLGITTDEIGEACLNLNL